MKRIIPFLLVLAALAGATRASAQALKAAVVTSSTPVATNAWVGVNRPAAISVIAAGNTGATDLYLLIFDATAVPADGAVPAVPFVKIPAGSTGGWDWSVATRTFTNGVVCATSTTPTTLTNSSAVFQIDITYNPK